MKVRINFLCGRTVDTALPLATTISQIDNIVSNAEMGIVGVEIMEVIYHHA